MSTEATAVFLCECGPILGELIDLDALADRAARIDGVAVVERYPTLCSPEGREWLAARLAEHPELRPVIAACTPREHADTFAAACEKAGRNPYLLSRANIREQCAWVTPDKALATAKAGDMVEAAVARVALHQPLEAVEVDCATEVLVVGAGVAGMTAALLLADSGRDVVVVEREPAIGGKTVLLGEIYPDMDCAPCMLEPLMDRLLHHPRIEVLTSAEVTGLLGYLGNYTAQIHRAARHVDADSCYACGSCTEACPAVVPDRYAAGLGERKAVQVPYTGALPNASWVDESACLRFNGQDCDACATACPFGNIDLTSSGEDLERHVGAVVIATGSEIVTTGDVAPWSLPAVITTWALERMLNPDGPTGGDVVVPGGAAPRSVALVHCADADGSAPASACSRTCCLSLAKGAMEIGHKLPSAQLVEFTWDRRLGGDHYRTGGGNGHADGSKVVEVRMGPDDSLRVEAGKNGGAVVVFTKAGAEHRVAVDLVVMAAPHGGDPSAIDMARRIGVELDAQGYVRPAHKRLRSFASPTEGIYTAGSAAGEKDVGETAAQAAAAAGAVMSALVPGRRLVREATTALVDDTRCGGCRVCVLSCPYKAISFDEAAGAAVVNALLCHGCGTCAAACPSSAITAKHFTDAQMLAETRALTRNGIRSQTDTPIREGTGR